MGDLNLDKPKANEREGKLLTDMEEVHELTCLINQPTHVITTSQTLLDVILTNIPSLVKLAGVAELGLSDHKLVYAFLNKAVKQHEARIVNCWSTKRLNLEEFKRDFRETEWLKNPADPVKEQYVNWRTKFSEIMEIIYR